MAKKANLAKSTQSSTPEAVADLDIKGLPSPTILAEYEKIVPGGAARLLELAEKRAIEERALERKTTEAKITLAKFKQAAYFILALSAGIFGGLLLLNGSELAGLLIILIDAAVITIAMLYGKK